MASKSSHDASLPAEDIEELLDAVDTALDRVKVLYEQYFLGIQKQAPTFIHNDVERKLRDLAQLQIRNTGLRYRLATLQQKFGAYNSYWRRTLRQIENGTYIRNLSKIGRQAARSGENIPEEILAAMPKRMREQVIRDRDQAMAQAHRRKRAPTANQDFEDDVAMIGESTGIKRNLLGGGAHIIQKADEDFDIDAFFESVEQEKEPVAPAPPPRASSPALRTGPVPVVPRATQTGPLPTIPKPPTTTTAIPKVPMPAKASAPSQVTRPIPVVPGAAAARGSVDVESMNGPFPRQPTAPATPTANARPPRPEPAPRPPPPPGMSEADVHALYAKYVKAKEALGETVGPGGYGKLLKTIHKQAPAIMQQYKAKAVEFSIVVKDNQVVIRAKPKQ